jgi:hypothetical protein
MVSVRRVVPILLLTVAIPLCGATKSSSRPPRELHRSGDHWTAYNPPDPASYSPGAKTYAIKSGDTLWALAQQFYGNAYLWPQLWESNTWITDAHWIYPGDVLLVETEAATPMPKVTASTSSTSTSTSSSTSASSSASSGTSTPRMGSVRVTAADPVGGTEYPVPLGTEADLYCYGYIGELSEPMPNMIRSYEDVEMRYQSGVDQAIAGSAGDLVMITGGTATGLVAGDTYMLVELGGTVTHPARHAEVVGRQYLYRGQVRILCADDRNARGIITESCAEVHPGARLKPMPQLPIPLARIPNMPAFCDPASAKHTGWIVGAQGGWDTTLGEGLLVTVDLGQNDVQPGDFLTVYRENVAPGQPRQVLGEIGILTTAPRTATGKIVAMRYSMKIGDRVEIR